MVIDNPRSNLSSEMSNDCDAMASTAPDDAIPFSVPMTKGCKAMPADEAGVTATSACALYIGVCISARTTAPSVTAAVISTIQAQCLSSTRDHVMFPPPLRGGVHKAQ